MRDLLKCVWKTHRISRQTHSVSSQRKKTKKDTPSAHERPKRHYWQKVTASASRQVTYDYRIRKEHGVWAGSCINQCSVIIKCSIIFFAKDINKIIICTHVYRTLCSVSEKLLQTHEIMSSLFPKSSFSFLKKYYDKYRTTHSLPRYYCTASFSSRYIANIQWSPRGRCASRVSDLCWLMLNVLLLLLCVCEWLCVCVCVNWDELFQWQCVLFVGLTFVEKWR